jgi:energy-coupling factor transporter transmembrane protein EcfT
MHGYKKHTSLRPFFRFLLGGLITYFIFIVLNAGLKNVYDLIESVWYLVFCSIGILFFGYLSLFGRVPRLMVKICLRMNIAERKMWKKLKMKYSK